MSQPALAITRSTPATVLVVDDEPDIRRLLQEILEDEHYTVLSAESAATARELYHRHHPDAVLLDIWMPGTDGVTLLKEWAHGGLEVPVIMMSGHGTVETAVEATRLGAYDFIEKPLSTGKLLLTLSRALETAKLKRENTALRAAAEPPAFGVGHSPLVLALRETLERVAGSDAAVLVSGEAGAGKLAVARHLHQHSLRRDHPLIEVGIAGVPDDELARQLYGMEKDGQITAGAFEQARGGTLVLNDIDELDAGLQSRLATMLAERRYRRLGGREAIELDVRLIALSRSDLAERVAHGRFNQDLYYRLNVVPLALPALRERREDIPELVGFFVNWMVDHERLPYRKFSTGALNLLRHHAWPGNLRELRNLVQRLLILNPAATVEEAEVTSQLGEGAAAAPAGAGPFDLPLKRAREDFERAYLEYHLERTGGNVAEVAKLVEMERTHLYRKLKQLGINPRDLKE
jgi:DNA-binding NtrC family response regulator